MLATLPVLETALNEFLDGLQRHGLTQDYALFHSLYTFGFRIRELRKCHEWSVIGGSEIECLSSKKSNKRQIEVSKAHPLLVESVERSKNFVFISSYTTYRRLFDCRIRGEGFCLGKKKLSTHIFRHCLAKRMLEQGHSPAQIQEYLGLKSLNVALGYIYSQIQVA